MGSTNLSQVLSWRSNKDIEAPSLSSRSCYLLQNPGNNWGVCNSFKQRRGSIGFTDGASWLWWNCCEPLGCLPFSYLVDPASNICLSQRLSHACLSINNFILWNCVQLIISAIIYLMVPYYMDNRGNSRANTCAKSRLLRGGMYLLDSKPMRALPGIVVIHDNWSNRMASRWR